MQLQSRTERRHSVGSTSSLWRLRFGPPFLLRPPGFDGFLLVLLGNGNPRPACGAAFSSVHNILSVFGLVPTRDEPAECLPWTRRTGVRRCFPCSGNVSAHSGRRWPRPYVRRFCPIFGIPSWLMPLRDRSGQRWQPLGKPYVVAATEVCSRFFGTCRALSPPSPPSLPRSFFAFWGFPERNTQDHPSLSWVCPWTIVRPSFLSSPSSLGVPGCFVIAGSPSFWCVPGRMCRSWEHLCLLLSFPLFSSSPCPLFPRARRVYKQTRLLQQVFLMRFGLSSVCPRSFGFPFIGPHRRFFPFFPLFFHVFLSSCLFILILSFSCVHFRPDLSLYTYTHAYFTYSEVQVAQVRYNEVWLIGCPSSLGSFSSATTHTFVCLVLLIFICPFCVHMCLPPFRAGWRSHMPPFGEACVCNPWNHRDPVGF